MSDTYQFQTNTGKIIEVDWATMMQQDAAGYLILEDGTVVKRVRMPLVRPAVPLPHDIELRKPIISDALGFTAAQLPEFEADRKANGFSGIEFVKDPTCEQFYQVKINSLAEWSRYYKHRGMRDKNSRNGGNAAPSQEELDQLQVRMLVKYPLTG